MSRRIDLAGCSVAIIEDDYYLAGDAQEFLEGAGARVLGPCSNAAGAMRLMETVRPDCALVDVNLGGGPSFEVAHALRARNVPFMFITGYDAAVIPEQFADVPRLEKPLAPSRMLSEIARLCDRRA